MKDLNQRVYQNLELMLFYKKRMINMNYWYPFSRSCVRFLPTYNGTGSIRSICKLETLDNSYVIRY